MAHGIVHRLAGAVVVAGLLASLSACGTAGGSSPPTTVPSGTPVPTGTPISSSTPTIAPTIAPTPAVTPAGPFTLTSDAFSEGGAIPRANACDGADTSPALSWTGTPAGTVTYALIVNDPDAGGFIHWVVFNVDPTASALAAGVPLLVDGGPPQGRNSFGAVGYRGPCPPSGTHHYRFRLLALSTRLGLSGTPSAAQVLAAGAGHIMGEAILTGTYRRH